MSTKTLVHLPDSVLENIRTCAAQTGSSMEQTIADALQNVFATVPDVLSEQERAIHALIAAGLVSPVSPAARRSARHISAQRRIELATAFSKGKPLSEIVIEDRGERL